MAKVIMVSVYDTVANLYGAPFHSVNRASAMRQFQAEQSIRPARSPMQTHPQDYSLFQLGTFDDATGMIELLPQPEFLVRGSPADSAE